jgi:hypothetical protein
MVRVSGPTACKVTQSLLRDITALDPSNMPDSNLPTVALDAVHRGNTNDSSVRALAVKPRARGAPRRGVGA